MTDDGNTCPVDWKTGTVKSVADVRFSSVDKKARSGERAVKLCNYMDVYSREYIRGDEEFMTASATDAEIFQFGLRQGDVLMTKDSETPDDIGIPSVIMCKGEGLVCGYHLALLRPDKTLVDPVFLAKQLRHHRLARYFGRMANGLTRYGLPTSAVENAELWLPEKVSEQERIGIVLQQVDAAIDRTERVIEKLKKIKAGMLHDLLTRGVDENGELRDPVAHPEQFKEVPGFGMVPACWEVKPLIKAASKIQDGTHFSPHSKSGPFLYLTSRNVRFGFLDLTDAGHISEKEHRFIYDRCPVEHGDVLLTKDGANTGNAALNSLPFEFSLLSSVAFIRCDGASLRAPFVLQFLLAPKTQWRLKDLELIRKQAIAFPSAFCDNFEA